MNDHEFESMFRKLTGSAPFPWQHALWRRMIGPVDDWPTSAVVPTGLGKTHVITVWLLALMCRPGQTPRRLAYVVNRRTVVDQTTVEVQQLRAGLRELGHPTLSDLKISTLRGQAADNHEWSTDPSQPAVICGTVDMIGSRLLFGGYRIGFKSRPLHAGFLGQDTLLVHDESHLEPAFQKVVEAIVAEQNAGERTGDLPWRKLRVLALSATVRNGNGATARSAGLTEEEKTPPETIPARSESEPPIHHVWRRLMAKKTLRLHEVSDAKKQADEIARLALEHRDADAAVLVFARMLDDVEKICKALGDKKNGVGAERVLSLTGTMRGLERDGLVEEPVFKRFLREAPREETVYLVCTSAGEVGVNLSADHLVCDLSTFDSMAQRFGRVNRFGDCEDTRIDVVHPRSFDDRTPDPQRKATLELLRRLDGDASPLSLGRLPETERESAFSPSPDMLPTTDILFDAWAMTTIRGAMPGRPQLAPYLHGVEEWEPLRTSVAWREEVGRMTEPMLRRHPPRDLLEDYPLKPHELLSDASERVHKELTAVAKRLGDSDCPVWVADDDGEVVAATLQRLLDGDRKSVIGRISGRTILLPPTAGGLSASGLLDGASERADDAADAWRDEEGGSLRSRVWSSDGEYDEKTAGMRLIRSVRLESADDDDDCETWDWYVKAVGGGRTATREVLLEEHVADVAAEAERIVTALALPEDLAQAVVLAARLHDEGKRCEVFQNNLGNDDPDQVLAKSGRNGARLRELSFRHEFASVAGASVNPEVQQLSPEMRDVVLHLIAAHHGRARPHFAADEAADSDGFSREVALETPRRFARLQRRYGRWGLAYLESLLRAADWAASAASDKEDGK